MRSLFAPRNHTVEAITAAYDRAAAGWHATISKFGFIDAYGHLLDAVEGDCARECQGTPTVLDAGSGTAGFALAFAQRYEKSKIDLLDLSREMLARGAKTLRTRGLEPGLICDDIRALPDRSQRYDIILSAHLIEHVDDVRAVLSALRTALTPGGLLLLVVSKPHWCTALVRLRWGHRAYRPAEMTRLLSASGLEDIHTVSFPSGPPSRLSAGYIARAPGRKGGR